MDCVCSEMAWNISSSYSATTVKCNEISSYLKAGDGLFIFCDV